MLRIVTILSALLTIATACGANFSAEAKVELSKQSGYVGEPVKYTVSITFDCAEIENVYLTEQGSSPAFELVGKGRTSGQVRRSRNDEKCELVVAEDTYIVTRPGKCTLPGSEYVIVFLTPATGYDPFWGYTQYWEREKVRVKAPAVSFKAKSLPQNKTNVPVGSFSLEVSTNEIDLSKGGNCNIIYTLRGKGYADDNDMPDFKTIFDGALRLNSVTPRTRYYYSEGSLATEITYVCNVTGKEEGSFMIPGAEIEYFDPQTGKYATTTAATYRVKVTSRDKSKEQTNPGMYVIHNLQNSMPTYCHNDLKK